MPFLIKEEVNLLRGIFLVWEMSKFLAIGWDSSPSPGFPMFRGEDEGGGWGIIPGDNPAGKCFVLRNLVPTSFFKQVMIV